jgi:hypothetical protein
LIVGAETGCVEVHPVNVVLSPEGFGDLNGWSRFEVSHHELIGALHVTVELITSHGRRFSDVNEFSCGLGHLTPLVIAVCFSIDSSNSTSGFGSRIGNTFFEFLIGGIVDNQGVLVHGGEEHIVVVIEKFDGSRIIITIIEFVLC